MFVSLFTMFVHLFTMFVCLHCVYLFTVRVNNRPFLTCIFDFGSPSMTIKRVQAEFDKG